MLFINPIHLIISVAFSSSVTPCFFAISFIRYSAISRAEVSISARCSYNVPLVSKLKYSTLLDKFLQITTIFSQETKKTILHRFLTPHNIVLLYLYFHCLRQRSEQSRHPRIAKYFHQQFRIYSLRYGNLIFFSILLMYIRIKIFLTLLR